MRTNKLITIALLSLVAAMPSCGGDDDDADTGTGGKGVSGASGSGGVARGGSGGAATNRGGATATGGVLGRGGAAEPGGNGPGGANPGGAGAGGVGGFGGWSSTEGGWSAGGDAGGGAGGRGSIVAVSDAEILQIVIVANDGEVSQGEVAVAKASHETVQVFAQQMIDHHTDAATEARALVTSTGITPTPSAVSAALEAQGQATVTALSALTEPLFDAAYMSAQVAAHQSVLVLVDDTLLPQATNAALRSYLVKMRATVQTHLTAATQIRADL